MWNRRELLLLNNYLPSIYWVVWLILVPWCPMSCARIFSEHMFMIEHCKLKRGSEKKTIKPPDSYILWFNFILLFSFVLWVWLCILMSLKQRKIKFKSRIKLLNHHIYNHSQTEFANEHEYRRTILIGPPLGHEKLA